MTSTESENTVYHGELNSNSPSRLYPTHPSTFGGPEPGLWYQASWCGSQLPSSEPRDPGRAMRLLWDWCPHLQTRHCCHSGLLGGVRFWWVSRWEVSVGQRLGGARGGTFATDPSHWGPPHPINVAGTLTHNKPMREALLVSCFTREKAHAQRG